MWDVVVRKCFHPTCTGAGLTPLHLASSQGRDKIVRIMVASEAKVDVNKKCQQGFNPLLTAAMEGGECRVTARIV